MRKINTNFVIGLFLVIAGTLVCLQIFDIINVINSVFIWWSLLALLGVVMMVNDRRPNVVSSLFIVIGIWNALRTIGIIDISFFRILWPLIIIIIGLNLMFTKNLFPKIRPKVVDGIPNYNGIFGAVEERLSIKDFKGLNATAIFGGVEINLTDIELNQKEAFIEANAMFGAITIIVPNDYNIVTGDNVCLFGGTENKVRRQFDENKNTIYINSRATFGGVEIK